jgi:acyl-CoA thioester hydrolase
MPNIPELADYPAVMQLPVLWGDQDAFGHVNNSVYFRWYETSRILYLEKAGLGDKKAETGIGPILAHIDCNYRHQVTFPDTMHVATRVTKIGRTSLTVHHAIYGEAAGAIVADSTSVLVLFDYHKQVPTPLSDEAVAAVELLEGRGLR